MAQAYRTKILGEGKFVPERVMTNDEISKMVDTNNQWIVERTGINQRRIADPKKEFPSYMACEASKIALKKAGLEPNDIDMILFSVTIPDMFFPNTASMLQHRLEITNNCACLDINAACTGYVYGFELANNLIKNGVYENILLVGCEMTSRFNNWNDRSTCILFGDGCGVTVLGRAQEGDKSEVLSTVMTSDSSKKDNLVLPGGGAYMPITDEVIERGDQYCKMNGPEIFKSAVKTMAINSSKVLQDAGLTLDDINWFVPHQANLRIIEATAKRLEFPMERVICNVQNYANTSSASIPIAFHEAVEEGKIQRGQNVLFSAFGAGLTSGSVLLRY